MVAIMVCSMFVLACLFHVCYLLCFE